MILAKRRRVKKRLSVLNMLSAVETVCREHHVNIDDVVVGNSSPRVVVATQAVAEMLHDMGGLSWSEIAGVFERPAAAFKVAAKKKVSRQRVIEDATAIKIAKWLLDAGVDYRIVGELRGGAWRGELTSAAITAKEKKR